MRVCIITCVLSREVGEMTDKEAEVAIKLYLKAEDIPFCDRIEEIRVLSG